MADDTAAASASSAPADAGGGAPAAATQPPANAPPAREEEWEIVVDGKPEKWTRTKAIAQLQMERAGQKRMEEAARIRRERDAELEEFKKNPKAVFAKLKEYGHDPYKLAEEAVLDAAAQRTETAEQKALRDANERLAKYEREQAEKVKAEEAAKQAEATAKYVAEYQEKFAKAIEAAGLKGKRGAAFALKRLIAMEERNLEANYSLPPEALVEEATAEAQEVGLAHLEAAYSKEGEAHLAALGGGDVKVGIQRVRQSSKVLRDYLQGVAAPKPANPAAPAVEKQPAQRNAQGQFTAPKSREEREWERLVGQSG